MSTIINLCSAQNTIDEIESFIFSGIINSNNKLSELIEFDEANQTTRHWVFNERYQLIREIDNRPSSWPYSAGWHSGTRPSEKIYNYKYHLDGKLEIVSELHKSEGETIKTIHTFSYPSENTINEFYSTDLGEMMKFDFLHTQVMKDSVIQESTQTMKNYIGDGYVETIQRLEYVYGKDKLLKQKNHYFTVKSNPETNESNPTQEKLGSKLVNLYDSYGRLEAIDNIEYTEEGSQKLRNYLTFRYNSKSNKIERIDVKYGENFTPNLFVYKIQYEENGDLKSIIINEKSYKYLTKR
ncbi:MAG: hypothetical protein ACJATI_005326 [Halioglobus sp.]|jgi:hypothetical protein